MDSYFTEQEYTTLLLTDMPKDAPLAISHVSKTQFSIARSSGGVGYKGKAYFYNPATDELIRDDVLKAVEKMRRTAQKEAKKEVRTESLF